MRLRTGGTDTFSCSNERLIKCTCRLRGGDYVYLVALSTKSGVMLGSKERLIKCTCLLRKALHYTRRASFERCKFLFFRSTYVNKTITSSLC